MWGVKRMYWMRDSGSIYAYMRMQNRWNYTFIFGARRDDDLLTT